MTTLMSTLQVDIQAARAAPVPPRSTCIKAESTSGRVPGLEFQEMVGVQRESYVEGQLSAEGVYVEVTRAARVEEAMDEVAAEVAEAVVRRFVD